MSIVAEYGKNIVFGAPGCCGVEVDNKFYINSGVSAGPAGGSQSYFAVWAFDNANYLGTPPAENQPRPLLVYDDDENMSSGNPSGQLPGNSTRRDSHGIVATLNKKYVHTFDRVQAQAYVINTSTNQGSFSYSMRDGNVCKAFAVTYDINIPANDPSHDLVETTPDGKYLAIGFRGPAPVTFSHTTQGSCPGVGIVQLLERGEKGKLITVLRTTNLTPDNVAKPLTIPGGISYAGTERSDIHMVAVIDRKLWTYAVISLLSIGVMKTTAIANERPCRGCCLECHQMYEELWLHHITKPNFVCLYVKKMLRFINVNFYHICLLSFYESRIFNCIITGNGGVGRHISTLEYVIAIEATRHRRGSGVHRKLYRALRSQLSTR